MPCITANSALCATTFDLAGTQISLLLFCLSVKNTFSQEKATIFQNRIQQPMCSMYFDSIIFLEPQFSRVKSQIIARLKFNDDEKRGKITYFCRIRVRGAVGHPPPSNSKEIYRRVQFNSYFRIYFNFTKL